MMLGKETGASIEFCQILTNTLLSQARLKILLEMIHSSDPWF